MHTIQDLNNAINSDNPSEAVNIIIDSKMKPGFVREFLQNARKYINLFVSKACALDMTKKLFESLDTLDAYLEKEVVEEVLRALCVFGEKFPDDGETVYDQTMREYFSECKKLFRSTTSLNIDIAEFVSEEKVLISGMDGTSTIAQVNRKEAEYRLSTLENICHSSGDRSVAIKTLIIEMLYGRAASLAFGKLKKGVIFSFDEMLNLRSVYYQKIIKLLEDDIDFIFFAPGTYHRPTTITEQLATGGTDELLAQASQRADCNQIYGYNTPLIWSIANASNSSAKTIITNAKHVDFTIRDKIKGNTAPHLAIAKGYTDKNGDGNELSISNLELVKDMVSKDNINMLDGEGNTLLHIACSRRDFITIKFLNSCGIDSSIVNNAGQTAEAMLHLGAAQAEAFIKSRTTVTANEFQKCYVFNASLYNSATADELNILHVSPSPVQEELELVGLSDTTAI